jgi:hypothetical protein
MQSSSSQADWDENEQTVRTANGGDEPDFWFQEILWAGVFKETAQSWEDEA